MTRQEFDAKVTKTIGRPTNSVMGSVWYMGSKPPYHYFRFEPILAFSSTGKIAETDLPYPSLRPYTTQREAWVRYPGMDCYFSPFQEQKNVTMPNLDPFAHE
jgi:hypothetical protein